MCDVGSKVSERPAAVLDQQEIGPPIKAPLTKGKGPFPKNVKSITFTFVSRFGADLSSL